MALRPMFLASTPVIVMVAALGAQQIPGGPDEKNPLAGSIAAIAAGRRTFERTCLSCHGDTNRAPNLASGAFVHGGRDSDLFRAIRFGVSGSQMPPFDRLTTDQIWELVAYIRSLSPAERTATGGAAGPGDAGAGESLFFGRAGCASCHAVNGRGGIVGPDLSEAGLRSADALRAKILHPDDPLPASGGRGVAAPMVVVARLQDGRELRGVRRNEDTFSLQMIDASGQLHLLDKRKTREVAHEARSLMPADYATRLTAGELQSVVAFLSTLKVRDASKAAGLSLTGGVSYERLRDAHAEPQNWMHYWGDYAGTHYSRLDQITPANVSHLQARWSIQLPGPSTLETGPLVVDGIMYTSGQPGTVLAIDAKSGRQLWRFTRPQKVKNPNEINPFSRGVAILGQRVYVGTLDAALVAIDARSGLPLWEVQVADSMLGYSITSAPLVLKDKVIVGVSGGEFGARGFLDAYDASSGVRLWRWHSVPPPGEFGNDTWAGDSWAHGAGPMWLTGSYDPDLNTLYWTVGNPGAQIDRSVRGNGDNLFTDSVVALDAETGRRKWHYQFTPNDGHDWDSTEDVVLVDRVWHGQRRKLLLHADRNAHFYVLDRTNGTFLSAWPFAYQNWNRGFDASGRPLPEPGSNSSPEGSFLVFPSVGGATNFQAPSYSPATGWFYLAYAENGRQYVSAPQAFEPGREYIGAAAAPPGPRATNSRQPAAGIKALDPETGRTMWDFKLFQGSLTNGVLATAGGILFAASRDGNFIALDARTGGYLWHFQTGGNMSASPMSFAVDGRQYVAIASGASIYCFALPE
jgi:PQQ-dependent dehydrogenase (methanol/ethanol family)